MIYCYALPTYSKLIFSIVLSQRQDLLALFLFQLTSLIHLQQTSFQSSALGQVCLPFLLKAHLFHPPFSAPTLAGTPSSSACEWPDSLSRPRHSPSSGGKRGVPGCAQQATHTLQ